MKDKWQVDREFRREVVTERKKQSNWIQRFICSHSSKVLKHIYKLQIIIKKALITEFVI